MAIKRIIRWTLKQIGLIPLSSAESLMANYEKVVERMAIYEKVVERRCEQIAKEKISPLDNVSSEAYKIWINGLKSELKFWYVSVAMDGWTWSEAYKLRINSDQPFQFLQYINHFSEQNIICLEVGAGAMPSLGREGVPGKNIEIIPTDALALAYESIFNDFGVKVRFPVRQCNAENLKDNFQSDMFHFTYAVNCLDHCYDPISAIQQMFDLTKPTGRVVLAHYINVAVSENYQGLHQWNLCEEHGRFVIWNKTSKYFLDDILPKDAEINMNVMKEHNWITVSVKKP